LIDLSETENGKLMRLTTKDALERGIIDKNTAKQIDQTGKRSTNGIGDAVARLNLLKLNSQNAQKTCSPSDNEALTGKTKASKLVRSQLSPGSREYRESATSPQKILFEALCARLPGRPQWEMEKLIPNRKFSADIFIPPNVVVEMDGFRFHRSKPAFQTDRDRQNLFVMHGYRVIRAYAGQIFDNGRLNELVELIVKTTERIDPTSGESEDLNH
jgi:very-short-patch-repair endonuclease